MRRLTVPPIIIQENRSVIQPAGEYETDAVVNQCLDVFSEH